ncbi:MAG: hypothetical protein GXP55_07190 [Deltaproteobacteria bacterium]|nr:hypothetical protein [Deltaproteobacteria bacterium]
MSEYQYYEFRAVDRLLTREEMSTLSGLSSRATVTPSSFINVYNFGDFRGDPRDLMGRCFDVFVYMTNWGTRWLMLRVPSQLLDDQGARAYEAGDVLSVERAAGDHTLLSFCYEGEGGGWEQGEGWLPSLLPVRAALMAGDERALYLGWLLGVQLGTVDDETLEPAPPPGLADLDDALEQLVDFLCLDDALVVAAGEGSDARPTRSLATEDVAGWLDTLPGEEKDSLLAALITAETPTLALELRRRAATACRSVVPANAGDRRSVAELRERADALRAGWSAEAAHNEAVERARLELEAAERRRQRILAMRGKASVLWRKVEQQIARRQARSYDAAVSTLCDLRDLAALEGTTAEYRDKLSALCGAQRKKTTLIDRLRAAGLLDAEG